MPIASLVDQQKAAVAKARAVNERPVDTAVPDSGWQEAENVLRDLGSNFAELGKGVVAGNLGSAVDITAMATLVGYEGLDWARGGTFNGLSEALLTPGGTDSIGKDVLNADIEGIPFIAGSLLSPSGIVRGLTTGAKVVGALPALKAMFVGARVQTKALTKTLSTAKGMHKTGRSFSDIWDETGWYPETIHKGGDVKWKYVLSDADSVVDSKLIRAFAENTPMRVGDESVLSMKLGDVFQHPTLFEAYPHLADVPIDIFVKRVDDVEGVADFKIYNQALAEKGIAGGVEVSASGRKTLKLSVDADKDLGRSTILHEVQHLVQAFEGFDEGSNVVKWTRMIGEAQSARVDKILTEDLVSGRIGIDVSEAEFFKYIDEVTAKTKANAGDIAERLDQFIASNNAQAAAIAASEATRTQRDVRMMLEAMADVEALTVGERTDLIIHSMAHEDIYKLAHSRYWRQAGEVEARLTQHLRAVRQEQLLARTPPVSPDTPLGRQIRGDELE